MQKKMLIFSLLAVNLISFNIVAKQVVFTTLEGENFILDISPQETFFQVAERIQEFATPNDNEEDFIFEAVVNNDHAIRVDKIKLPNAHRNNPQSAREYYRPLEASEMYDIRFIITTLANKSYATIFGHKTELESAGDRIANIHPLRFLCYVFSDEELKVGIHNIRNRKLIWKDFSGGIKESLNSETNFQNMRDEYIENFTRTVEISYNLVYPSIQKRNWDELFDVLITHVPRKGDHRRYDN